MEEDIHKPIRTTNQSTVKERRVFTVINTVLSLLAIGLIGAGVYVLIMDIELWGISFLAFVIAVIPAMFVYYFYTDRKHEDEYEYRFELNEKGIIENYINHETGQQEEIRIPFSSIQHIIVGNVAEYNDVPDGLPFYRFHALMIIHHTDGIYLQHFSDHAALEDWIGRFLDKNCPLYKTDKDLQPALLDTSDYRVDFSKVEGYPWDGKTDFPPVGAEKLKNPFEVWRHGAAPIPEDISQKENKTRLWEKRVAWILFVFSLFVGGFVLPGTPLDADKFVKIDGTIILGMVFIALFIPVLFLYWRNYTKWYTPLIYIAYVTVGNTIAMIAAFLILEDAFIQNVKLYFLNILFLNGIFLLPGWLILLALTKGLKWVIGFYRDFYDW